MKTGLILIAILLVVIFISACTPTSPQPALATAVTSDPPPPTPKPGGEIHFVSTGQTRYLPTSIDLAVAAQIDIPLSGTPAWIAGIPFENGSAWAVAFEDGSLQAFFVTSDGYTPSAISPDRLSEGMPPTVYSQGEALFALTAPGTEASPLSAPVLLDPPSSAIAFIAANGDLVLRRIDQETRLPVDALPDSSILADGNGTLMLLTKPSDRYAHSVLGDGLEATAITLVETEPGTGIIQTILITEPDVIEGLYPIWADINNDGEREIIVTLSNAQSGARIVAFREDGSLLAEGPPVGAGFRWRHQLAAAPFGDADETLLAVVRTPHIGGVLEFYRLQGNKLEIVAEIPGISTHMIGSRNLFTALAGDFDNDGQVELLAPDQAHTRLGMADVRGGITWLDLGAELVTNLAAVDSAGSGHPVIAAGLSNNSLRLWMP